MGEASAIDVERFEDLQDGFGIDAPIVRPTDDVQVFLTGCEAIENAIEEEGIIVKLHL